MYEEIRQDTIFIMLYGVVIAMAAIACCYLLFRDGNAFDREVTPPLRLRRWTAVLFASIAMNHLWYLPIFFLSSNEDVIAVDLIGGVLDTLTFFPLAIVVLFVMLQDRRRPLWPIAAIMAPLVVGGVAYFAIRSHDIILVMYAYFLLMCIALTIYMVRSLRQYGRWLRDNFADLEHKELWKSFVVLTILMAVFGIYVVSNMGPIYHYAMQIIAVVLICHLLWRVETLSSLNPDSINLENNTLESVNLDHEETVVNATTPLFSRKGVGDEAISALLQKHCIDTQLYLQHDLTLLQLAKALGTNRFYLSQYFSSQGMTYNAYINELRIDHFISLYREAIAARHPFTAQQLAHDSGYHSYSTFSHAFKQRMGQTVTAWMRDETE
jgi:AraC-like DNA-binding protein